MGVALLFATGCSSDSVHGQNSSGEDEPDVAATSQPPESTEDAVDRAELVVTRGPILTMGPGAAWSAGGANPRPVVSRTSLR